MSDPPDAPLGFAALPGPLRARVEAELSPGERLLWAAQPNPNRPGGPIRSRSKSLVWSLAWTALGVFWLLLSFRQASRIDVPPNPLWIVGIVFGAIASVVSFFFWAGMVAGRVESGPARDREGQELYALSDRRALIWQPVVGSSGVTVRQYPRGSIRHTSIERLEYPDGSGDLLFGTGYPQPGFRGVAEVRRLDDLVRHVLIDPSLPPPAHDEDYEEPF